MERLAACLRTKGIGAPDVAVVLGSGLGAFADAIDDPLVLDYGALDGMPRSAVVGHAGRLVVGAIDGVRVVVQQGRVHLYEGWSASDVTVAVRAFAALGVTRLLLTNAAGGLVADWPPGTLMRITDHVSLQGAAPLAGSAAGGPGSPWDAKLGAALVDAARAEGVTLAEGVYLANTGPAYETPAEVRLAGRLGAQAVGMSTALEAIAGAAAGMRVAGVSCITNHAAGIQATALSHEEVVAAGASASADFVKLLHAAVPRLVAC